MNVMAAVRRHLFFAAHEALLGRRTLRFARELEESQWLSPAEIREKQHAKLRLLLRHAWQNIPFYRHRLEEAGIDPRSHGDLGRQLPLLPLLTKQEIREAGSQIVWPFAPGGVFPSCTGGSSGEPLRFFLDRRRQAYDQAARIRTHRWFGIELGECELFLWGSPIDQSSTDRMKTWRDRILNQHLLDAFQMSDERMDRYLDQWDQLQPAALFGYPSSIALFIGHAKTRNRKLDTSRLRAVFVTGEVCYPHDRREIEEYFGVPVADGYGSREAGFIAHQCPLGSMHITAENALVEIVQDGRRVPTGETGEIVVTHLDAYAMPFIRYRTGDIGRLLAGRCACGRGLPLMDIVQGRSTDFLVLPDGTIKHALSIIYPLREMEGISNFRVVQGADLGVTVEVVASPAMNVESVAQRIRPIIGKEVSLQVKLVPQISEMPSGKFRYVISSARSTPAQESCPK